MRAQCILWIMLSFRGERSLSAVYHLLQGKRSIQTIYDAHLFQLQRYFGLFPQLSRNILDNHLQVLEQQGYIQMKENDYTLTEKGHTYTMSWRLAHPYIDTIDNWRFGHLERTFWQRLVLLCQSLSHLALHKSFVPIVQTFSVQRFVKGYIRSSSKTVDDLCKQLYEECFTLLSQVATLQAELFVRQLSSAHHIGATLEQLAHLYGKPVDELFVRHKSTCHFILKHVLANKHEYPSLSRLITEEDMQLPMATSTEKTAELLEKGLSIREVAHQRRLKVTTIEDHVVALALLNASFPIDCYVVPEKQEQILRVSELEKTLKLKTIRQALNEKVSYFEIRLALTRKEGHSCSHEL
ncbi:helix-turn-helix domain-containing protein [Bacillus sp. FSL W7-1360]